MWDFIKLSILSSLCVTLAVAAADKPELLARNIVNAADYSAGHVTPGEIVVLFPTNVGPPILAGAQLGSDGRITTELGETRIWFDSIPAPMAYSVSGQIAAVVPFGIANQATTEVVVEYQGVRSTPVTLPVVASAPALFTLDSSGRGQAAMLNEKVCCNSARHPARRGSIGVLYATGAGQSRPQGTDGHLPAFNRISDYPVPRLPVKVTVGGKTAKIIYAGAAPHAIAGLLQVNFRIPDDTPLGDAVPLVLAVGAARSSDAVTMAVRSSAERILVIDHQPAVRAALRGILTGAGYEVFTARNGAEAMEQAVLHRPDLIVSDLASADQADDRMATMSALRAELPRLKLIATVATLGPRSLRAADLLGAQAILTHPVASSLLLKRARELLR